MAADGGGPKSGAASSLASPPPSPVATGGPKGAAGVAAVPTAAAAAPTRGLGSSTPSPSLGAPPLEPHNGALFWMSPCIAFSIVVGLGLDYDIFLMEAVVEAYDQGATAKEAVRRSAKRPSPTRRDARGNPIPYSAGW